MYRKGLLNTSTRPLLFYEVLKPEITIRWNQENIITCLPYYILSSLCAASSHYTGGEILVHGDVEFHSK